MHNLAKKDVLRSKLTWRLTFKPVGFHCASRPGSRRPDIAANCAVPPAAYSSQSADCRLLTQFVAKPVQGRFGEITLASMAAIPSKQAPQLSSFNKI